MDKDTLKEALKKGLVEVTFTKLNGDTRVMTCTLNEDIVPPATKEDPLTQKKVRAVNEEVQVVQTFKKRLKMNLIYVNAEKEFLKLDTDALAELDAEIGDLDTALDENIFENDFNGQEIFVRVENIKNSPIVCVNTRLSFKINIKPLPSFFVIGEENIDDPQIVCLNNTPLILEAENPDAIYDYQWTNEAGEIIGSDRTLGVTTAGKYTVTASDILPNGCSRSRTIVVKESNIATLEESFITIIDEATNIGNTDNISVSIDIISNNLGPGEYQFAITNEDTGKRYPFSGFQDEPIFENLEGGIYTITVNDKNGCAPDTELQISVIQFPKFFTPNGDGKNDVWSVKGANKIFYPNSSIDIFNRFGKLVAQIPIDSQGWDGTYNGTKLSSDDYWFRVQLIPANTSKVPVNKKGHFSLLRR